MVYCIFIDNKMTGYAMLPYSSASKKEIVLPVAKTDLIELAGEDWQDQYHHIAMVGEELVFMTSDEDETN